ncbi:MAG: hypothetical protein LBE58_06790 [Comamonas sp.]|jgi:hypothetical protein|nr:hypothetical protein [Comamonas sp.]
MIEVAHDNLSDVGEDGEGAAALPQLAAASVFRQLAHKHGLLAPGEEASPQMQAFLAELAVLTALF